MIIISYFFERGFLFMSRDSFLFSNAPVRNEGTPSTFSQPDSSMKSNEFLILNNRCRILENILYYADISPMPSIIKDFKSMSDFYLHQLVKEIEFYRFSSPERSQLLDFLHYLHSVTHEIEDMLFVEH